MTRKQILSIVFMTASVFSTPSVVPLFAQTNEPSLGEVARKNRAEQTKAKAKAKPKVTEEDMPSRPMSTATVTNYGSSASLGSSSTDTNASASQASGETTPEAKSTTDSETKPAGDSAKPQPDAQVDRVTQLKKDQESLNSVIEQLKAKIAASPSEERRQTLSEVLRNTEQRLEEKQKELSEAERSAPRK
jgi:hypothetical protein